VGDLWLPFAVWGATVLLVLVAAKAHGRQIRLEREKAGYRSVDFRAANPPFVEALWRRDRVRFWPWFAILALASGAAWYFGPWRAGSEGLGGLALRVAWSFASAFVFAGMASLARLLGDREGEPAWRRRAVWGSAGWWSGVAALAALLFWLWRL
jgi:hypothetical protein